jgi:hypothetical protein
MPKFLYVYHGQPSSPPGEAEMAEIMKAWMAWFGKLRKAVVDGGNPTGEARTVSAKGVTPGGGANPASGYSLIEAKDMDAACEMAKGCPMVPNGGHVEVCAIVEM